MDALALLTAPVVAILILFTPFAAAWRIAAFYALIVCVIGWWLPPFREPGIGHTFGMVIISVVLFVLFGLFMLRAGVHAARSVRESQPPEYHTSPPVFVIDLLLAVFLGGLAGTWIFISIGWGMNAGGGGFKAHYVVALIGFAIGAAFLWPVMLLYRKFGRSQPVLAACGFAAVFVSLGILSALGALYPGYVTGKAEKIASSAPYCLILEKRGKTAEALEELTFFTMDKRRNTNHATLIVERDGKREHYHWSYRFGQFRKGGNKTYFHCDPLPRFGDKLAKYTDNDLPDGHVRVILRDMVLHIPKAYRPKSSGSSYLSIKASAPDFHPGKMNGMFPGPSFDIRDRSWVNGLARDITSITPSRMEGPFEVFAVVDGYTDHYVEWTPEGAVATHISCLTKSKHAGRCQHRFYRNDRMYSFEHETQHLPKAKAMQEKLFSLFVSFER